MNWDKVLVAALAIGMVFILFLLGTATYLIEECVWDNPSQAMCQ